MCTFNMDKSFSRSFYNIFKFSKSLLLCMMFIIIFFIWFISKLITIPNTWYISRYNIYNISLKVCECVLWISKFMFSCRHLSQYKIFFYASAKNVNVYKKALFKQTKSFGIFTISINLNDGKIYIFVNYRFIFRINFIYVLIILYIVP